VLFTHDDHITLQVNNMQSIDKCFLGMTAHSMGNCMMCSDDHLPVASLSHARADGRFQTLEGFLQSAAGNDKGVHERE
jgi:hypothetical protein